MIRAALPTDAAQIASIYNPFIRNSIVTFEESEVTADDMAQRIKHIQSAGLPYLVSEEGTHIEGYAYASIWKSRAAYKHTVEVSVYIDPASQGKGLGQRLYTALFETLLPQNYHAVIGVITLPNEASIRLHEHFGMKKVAHFTEVGRKFGRWIDVGYWQGFLDDAQKIAKGSGAKDGYPN